MQLKRGAHLAYCTNVHPGEDWTETFSSLENYTVAVRNRVCPEKPFAIGLRLSDKASRELKTRKTLNSFRDWLKTQNCYVFTINGFPFGSFHHERVKEHVFTPDWTTQDRLDYTKRLFDILVALLPDGMEGSVSTLPGSFKEFVRDRNQIDAIVDNLWSCIDHISAIGELTGHDLHLGVEPEPFGLFENTAETVAFFEQMAERRPGDPRLYQYLGVNYDACHFAIEYGNANESLAVFQKNNIRISKIHLSSALRTSPNETNRKQLQQIAEDTYLHQVIARRDDGALVRYRDLPAALADNQPAQEWRIHFHVPLYAQPTSGLQTTIDDVLAVLDWLAAQPGTCHHLEMETYTWEVLPPALKSASVIDQLVREYEWIQPQLVSRAFL